MWKVKCTQLFTYSLINVFILIDYELLMVKKLNR